MPSSYTELNGADEATVGPIREALKASEKARSLRFPAAAAAPPSAEMPSLVGAAGKSLVVNATENGVDFANSVGATDFTALGDVPSSYVGQAGKKVIVKATEDGLDFVPDSGGGGGSGDVVGPASATDNAIARFDGTTGKGIQNSPVTISDNGTIAMVGAATGYPSANIPHGTAPTSPSNGDMWTTTGGLFVRINGATVGPLSGGSALSFITESSSTSSPNATVYAAALTVSMASTNADLVLSPKGTGALLANLPNGGAGGDKRGASATDWQRSRSASTQVAGATGSTISGGRQNTAAGDDSTVSGGLTNTANGTKSTIGGGSLNSASGTNSVIGGGLSNSANGTSSCVTGGESNTASGPYSCAQGLYAQTRSIHGASAAASGRFSAAGDAQVETFILRRQTTDATPAVLSTSGAAPASTNVPVLPNSHAYKFRGMVIARASGGDVKTWDVSGTIKRGANAAATALVGTPSVVSTDADTAASTWTVAITADTTYGAIVVTGTGASGTNINWVARIETVEVG